MKSIFLLFLICLPQLLHAQSIIVNAVGNDCVKCKYLFEEVFSKTKIPKFLIFPESYIDDSTAINIAYGAYDDVNIVYSDDYYKKNLIGTSSISYLSYDGSIKLNQSIAYIDSNIVGVLDSIYKKDFVRKGSIGFAEWMYGDWWIKQNMGTGMITFDSNNVFNYKLSLDTVVYKDAQKALLSYDPHYYKLTQDALSKGILSNSDLKPILFGYKLRNNDLYYTMAMPRVVPNTPEEIAQGFKDGRFYQEPLLVKENILTQERDFFPILDKNNDGKLSIHPSSFLIVDDSNFVFFYNPTDTFEQNFDKKYLSLFTLKNKVLTFEKRLTNEYPTALIESGFKYEVIPSMNCYDYPYYVSTFGNIISDIKLNKDIDISPRPLVLDFSKVNINFLNKILSQEENWPIENLYVVNLDDKLFLFSKIDFKNHLLIYNKTKKGDLIYDKIVDLEAMGLKFNDNAHFYFDKKSKIVFYKDDDMIMRSIPLALLTS